MDDRAAGTWGELKAPEPELTYPRFLDSEICRMERAATDKQRKAKNRRMWRRVENWLWKTAWIAVVVALGLALI